MNKDDRMKFKASALQVGIRMHCNRRLLASGGPEKTGTNCVRPVIKITL